MEGFWVGVGAISGEGKGVGSACWPEFFQRPGKPMCCAVKASQAFEAVECPDMNITPCVDRDRETPLTPALHLPPLPLAVCESAPRSWVTVLTILWALSRIS